MNARVKLLLLITYYNVPQMKEEHTVLSTKEQLHLLQLMLKYQVKILDYEPGKVTLSIGTWDEFEALFLQILEDLFANKLIHSYDIAHPEISIAFAEEMIHDATTIDLLLTYISKYQL